MICGEGQSSHGSEQMVVITCANVQLHLIIKEVLRKIIFLGSLHISSYQSESVFKEALHLKDQNCNRFIFIFAIWHNV